VRELANFIERAVALSLGEELKVPALRHMAMQRVSRIGSLFPVNEPTLELCATLDAPRKTSPEQFARIACPTICPSCLLGIV
jgi:hypothetical protein